ncbi:hypothetical protein ACM66B_003491 [Microbotryomycetes sp. NB124-2]
MADAYRPRKRTAQEDEDSRELQRNQRARQVERRTRDKNEAQGRKSFVIGDGGTEYRDFKFHAAKTNSRNGIDRERYQLQRRTRKLEPDHVISSVVSLQSSCIRILAENWASRGALDDLSRNHHAQHVKALFEAVVGDPLKARRNGKRDNLPFMLWARCAATFGEELPSQYRSYRGLALSDLEELDSVKAENDYAIETARSLDVSVASPPTFFLTIIDLANAGGITDTDIIRFRPVAPMLSALRLDGSPISDYGLSWITRGNFADGSYQRLEILSLRRTAVSNAGAVAAARLPLRMLDVRNTKCDASVMDLLNKVDSPFRVRWLKARKRPGLQKNDHVEFDLFSDNLTLPRILSTLHALARLREHPTATKLELKKPISIIIDSLRQTDSSDATSFDQPGDQQSEPPKKGLQIFKQDDSAKSMSFHPLYGMVTSTSRVSGSGLYMTDESTKGSAFRARDDSVASGVFVGGSAGGPNGPAQPGSLFSSGTKKLSKDSYDFGAFSDTEDELEIEQVRKVLYIEELKRYQREQQTQPAFYHYSKPKPYAARQSKYPLPKPNQFVLLRNLPFKLPHEMAIVETTQSIDLEPTIDDTTLCRKKNRVSIASATPAMPLSSSPSGSSKLSSDIPTPVSNATTWYGSSSSPLPQHGDPLICASEAKKTNPFAASSTRIHSRGSAAILTANANRRDLVTARGDQATVAQLKDRQNTGAWSFKQKDAPISRKTLKAFQKQARH